MRLHIYPPPAEAHALGLQPQPLLNGRVSGQLDLTACSQNPLPRQPKSTAQSRCHLPRCSRKPRRPRDPAISRHLPARNRTHRLLDPQTHRSRILLLGFSRQRPAALPSHNTFHPKRARVPHPSRVLCERVGILTVQRSYAALRNASSASYSELCTSNTVSSLVTCIRSPTRLVRLASLIVPPALCAVVCSATSVPSPPESM